MAGGSASALSLSRPAQASLTLRPVGLLSRLKRPLSRGSSPSGYPAEPLVSYQDQSTTLWVESSSTSDPRLRGALPKLMHCSKTHRYSISEAERLGVSDVGLTVHILQARRDYCDGD